MQVGGSRLPRRRHPHPAVPPVVQVVPADPAVEIALLETAPQAAPVGMAVVAVAVAASVAALGPAVAVEAAVVSAVALAPVVPQDGLAGVETDMCPGARCAPSAWTGWWRSTTRMSLAFAATCPSAARSSRAARPAPALDTSVASAPQSSAPATWPSCPM